MERDPQTGAVLGAAVEVHRCLGRGFPEAVYQEAWAWELTARGIPFRREVDLHVRYKGQILIDVIALILFYEDLILSSRLWMR